MTADIYLAGKGSGGSGLEGVREIKYFEDFEREFLKRFLEVLGRSFTWNNKKKEYEVGPDFLRDFVYVDGDSGTIDSILEKLKTPLFLVDYDRINRTDGTDRTDNPFTNEIDGDFKKYERYTKPAEDSGTKDRTNGTDRTDGTYEELKGKSEVKHG